MAVFYNGLGKLLRAVGDKVKLTLYGWSGIVDAISDGWALRYLRHGGDKEGGPDGN